MNPRAHQTMPLCSRSRASTSNLKLETYRSRHGLSLIEMMVTVALLAIIILGLVAMFEQTRKAFSTGLANVDYQDSGRVALDLIARELQQMAPVNPAIVYANTVNGFTGTNTLNFYSDFEPDVNPSYVVMTNLNRDSVTNVMQRVLFVTQYNQTWNVVGYRVIPNSPPNGYGTLYQYRAAGTATTSGNTNQLILADFLNDTNAVSPVIDGVVGFRVRAYDPNGNEILPQATPGATVTANYPNTYPVVPSPINYGYTYLFSNNVVPAYVQLELTVMESKTLDRYNSMAGQNAQTFWTNHIGQMHLFKQRVSIPSLDRTAFP